MKRVSPLALLLLVSILAPASNARQEPAPQEVGEDEVVRVSTNLVTVPVSVLDRHGRFVPDLRREDFRVYEDGVEQEIAHFESADKPFTVALLLDTSDSVHFKLDDIKRATLAFVEQLRPEDRVIVIAFDRSVRVVAEATSDREELRAAVSRLSQTARGTALYDAVRLTASERLSKVRGRKAVVLLTDGVDNASTVATYAGTLEAAEELDALVYPVQYDTFQELSTSALGPSFMGVMTTQGTSPVTGQRESLRQSYDRATRYLSLLASRTGGDFFQAESVSKLSQNFARIAQQLRQQYSLGYYPKRPAEGGGPRQRDLRVRVKRENLAVRARRSYVVK